MDDALIVDLSRELIALPKGADYYKVDLHVHSPGSFDFAPDKDPAVRQMDAADFVSAWLERGVAMIAVTDHNNGSFVNELLDAANKIVHNGRRLHVLPGVELTVQSGVHLLAIFPPDVPDVIDDFLSKLDLPQAKRNREDSLVDKGLHEIREQVRARGGLLIGAHADSTKGVIAELTGQPRLNALACLDCLEVSTSRTTDPSAKIQYARNALGFAGPFVYGSDSHNPLEAPDAMWVKMAEPNFNGLKQFLFEPELRISTDEPSAPSHTRIIGCTTTHGVYGATLFGFSPNLNVIIGGKGAGKSALVDLLRFAFEVEPLDQSDRKTFAMRLQDFLQGVGEVLVLVETGSQMYAIVRSGAFVPDEKKGPEFTEAAKVYQISGESALLRDLHPKDVAHVEFYGQGEASNLTKRVKEQMRLIDENLDIAGLKSDEATNVVAAERLEAEIVSKLEQLDGLESEIVGLSELQERRDYLDGRLSESVFARHTLWTREQVFFKGVEASVAEIGERVDVKLDSLLLSDLDMTQSPNRDTVQQTKDAIGTLHAAANSSIEELKSDYENAANTIRELLDQWRDAFDGHQEAFRKELIELGLPDLAAVSAERDQKQAMVEAIEQVKVPKRARLTQELETLRSERKTAIDELRRLRGEIRQEREKLVQELNNQLGGVVSIEFLTKGDLFAYIDFVKRALEGSGMQNRPEQVRRLCEGLSPTELAAAVRGGDVETLSQKGGLTSGNTTIALRHLSEEEIMAVERVEVAHLPNIRLRREGETAYSDLENLSVGEQCSAILSIALLDKNRPLVIDQPEDELDHAFVTESIVEGIKRVKHERQIIVSTHNPNIPVLGDAELVFRVHKLPGLPKCAIKTSGGIEVPAVTAEVQMLEGGQKAFERRRQRYEGRL